MSLYDLLQSLHEYLIQRIRRTVLSLTNMWRTSEEFVGRPSENLQTPCVVLEKSADLQPKCTAGQWFEPRRHSPLIACRKELDDTIFHKDKRRHCHSES